MDAGLRRCTVLAAVLALLLPVAAQTRPGDNDFQALLHRGFEFHQREQYSEALPLLQRAWKLQPHDYFVNLLLGIDLLRTGRASECIAFLKEAERQRPKEEFPQEYLGEAQAALDHYAEAAAAYGEAVRVAPQSSQAAVALVDFSLARFATLSRQLRSSQRGLAAEYRIEALSHAVADPLRRQLLRRSAALDPGAPGIWSELAIADLGAGDQTSAAQDAQQALQRNPGDLRAWQADAMLAAEKGDWNQAARRLNAIAQRSPATLAQAAAQWPSRLQPAEAAAVSGPAALFLACVGHANCSPSELARKLPPAQRCASASPANLFHEQRWECLAALPSQQPRASLQRGTALAHMARCDRAIPALERGLSSTAEVEPMFLLSVCYARQAGEVASRLQQSASDAALLHMIRGDILLRLRADGAGAAAEYKSALASGDKDGSLWARLAEAQLAAAQPDLAQQSARQALELNPHSLPAMRTLARIAMQNRDYSTALPYLRQLAQREPQDLGTRVELGTACAQTGALEQARSNLGTALQHGYPDQKGSLHYLLGTVLRRLGRAPEAEQAFAAARRLSDNFQQTSHRDQDEHP
jgi:tetratricopeptide (TPR) repeat protein